MRIRKAIVQGAIVLAGLAGILAPAAAGASTVTHHAPKHERVIKHDFPGGSYRFQETNGSFYIGSLSTNAGTPVIETGLAKVYSVTITTSYGGDSAGWIQNSAGNFVAATNNCDNVTQKSSVSSFGTVWAFQASGTPGAYNIVSRGCDQNAGSKDTVYLGGQNMPGLQLIICDSAGGGCHGFFTKMTPS